MERLIVWILVLLLVGCASATPTPTPAFAPDPTSTFTEVPSSISVPTDVPTSTPSYTPQPTATVTSTFSPTPLPPSSTPYPTPMIPKDSKNVKVLMIVPENYGANGYLTLKDYELFGWEITTAGPFRVAQPCPYFASAHGCKAMVLDLNVADVLDVTEYDVVAIMQSTQIAVQNPYGDLLDSPETLALIRAAAEQGVVIHAPCASTRVLAAAGILEGKMVTGKARVQGEAEAAGAIFVPGQPPPVIDENIVTSVRGLYYHRQAAEAVATALESQPLPVGLETKGAAVQSAVHSIDLDGALWTRVIGGESSEGGRALAATDDGGYVMVGYTFSFGAGNSDVYLLKLDAQGELLWAKNFGGPGWEYGNSVVQTGDGGYVLVGYSTSMGAGSKDVYMVKTDGDGNELWVQTFGDSGVDVGHSVFETHAGDLIVAGYSESFTEVDNDAYLIKTDADGKLIWAKNYGGEGLEVGMSVIETVDGNYVMVGATGSSTDNADVYLLKVDPDGNELWSYAYGGAHSEEESILYDWGSTVQELDDGGFIIAGNSNVNTFSSGDIMDAYLLRVDADGNQLWFGGHGLGRFYDYGTAASQTDDGGFLMVGASASPLSGLNDVFVLKVDSAGKTVWERSLGHVGSDWASAMVRADDGGFVVAGHTSSFGSGSYDAMLVKISSELTE